MKNWSELNQDLVVEIAKRIKLYQDFLAFRGVCTSCRSAANIRNFSYKSDQMPLLLLPPDDDEDGSGNRRRFFNPSNAMCRQVCLPETAAADANKRCLSSKGWLLSTARDLSLTLVHPFSRAEIELPNVKAFEDWYDNLSNTGYGIFIDKFVLATSNLLESDFVVMVVYGSSRILAYFKQGQKNWITADNCSCYLDVVYYKDKFHAIDVHGKIMAWDLSGDDPRVGEVVAMMPSEIVKSRALEKLYLVESDGALLVVRRQGAYPKDFNSCYGTYAFEVFKVDLLTDTWMEIKDIGNRALFLGHNSSLSVQALDSSICIPNSIYFTDDCCDSYLTRRRRGGGKDMGIYNIQDGSIIPHFKGITEFHNDYGGHGYISIRTFRQIQLTMSGYAQRGELKNEFPKNGNHAGSAQFDEDSGNFRLDSSGEGIIEVTQNSKFVAHVPTVPRARQTNATAKQLVVLVRHHVDVLCWMME